MEKTRLVAIEILDVFEELLARYGIMIPDVERDDEKEEFDEDGIEEACIYGQNYYELEDRITEILEREKNNLK
ncbi:MAG TPA: hypothetical protein PLZ08_09880 [Bacillota bacterium]|jgi:hypothetical protein|nr:hypothetical protein [Bacillota bacterium]HOL10791.1 hypothetical protein [Bacillota bacterium]HPO98247.1 hypothetical protein [Bacillota bacterium]